MLSFVYKLVFRWMGWKIEGSFPHHIKKCVVAVAPHTSSWDFVIGILARSELNIQKAKFLGKDSLFRPPFGWIFRAFGGYPVDRSKSHDMVEQVAALFADHDEFILGMAPEGTRKKVEKLRTGFYYIAKRANIPIIPVGFDFSKKSIVVAEPFYTTDNFESDMKQLMSFYRSISGKNPELGL